MIKSRANDVKRGFELAGRSELFEPFLAQIDTVPIERKEYRKGTSFEWMFFKKAGGQVGIAQDVT